MNPLTKEKVISEMIKIIQEEGRMHTQKILHELNKSNIVRYSYKWFGGLRNLAIICGVDEKNLKKKFGHWKNLELLKIEMKNFIEELGRYPIAKDFRLHNRYDLVNAISTYHGGLNNFRKLLGYINNYPIALDGHTCDSFSEVIIDDFLSSNSIEHKRNIQFNFKNIKCRPDFCLESNLLIEVLMADYRKKNHQGKYKRYVERYKKKRAAYIKNGFEIIEIFPQDLMDRSRLDKKLKLIADTINAPKPYKLKGFSNIKFFDKKSPGYWKDPKNLKKELMPLIKQYGTIPPIKVLREIGRSDIEGAIVTIYGSYQSVARALNLDANDFVKPQGFWKEFENIKNELLPVITQCGFLPSGTTLKKMGKADVVSAMEIYFPSFRYIAEKLGVEYRPLKRSNRHWLSKANIKEGLEKIITKTNKFPNAKELKDLKQHGLLKGIFQLYGSFRNAALELGYDVPLNKPKGYWKNIDNIYIELNQMYKKYGKIPPSEILAKESSMLLSAIKKYHGGLKTVKPEFFKIRRIIV